MLQSQETTAPSRQVLKGSVLKSLASKSSIQKPLERPKILLVDDVGVVRHVLRRSLECLSFEVVEAAGGREAISIYLKEGHDIAGVLLDMSMPDLDGIATFRALKAIDPEISVVMASGSFTESSLPPKGTRACLPKPCSLIQLKESMQNL